MSHAGLGLREEPLYKGFLGTGDLGPYFDALPSRLNQSFPVGITPGLLLPRHQPLYSWQFTRSQLTSSQTTTTNSSTSSKNPFTRRKRSRLVQPGNVTRTEQLGSPSRPLRWLSPSTLTTFPSSSHPSSSSPNGSRSKKQRKLTATPSVPIATDLDTLLPDAPRNTSRAPTVHFIILTRLTDAKTLLALRAATLRLSQAAAAHHPPTAPNVVTTMMPSPGNAGLDQSLLLNPRPPHLPTMIYLTSSPTVRKPWMWVTMAAQHPLLPRSLQPRLSTFPPPDPTTRETPLPPKRVLASAHWPGPATEDPL